MAVLIFGRDQKPSTESSSQRDADADLIRGCQNGDRAAQYALYQRYKDTVFNLALRMTNHEQKAEDVTQNVFLKVFKKINGFRGDAAFSSWLYRIAANTCINQLRKDRSQRSRFAQEEAMWQDNHSRSARQPAEPSGLRSYLQEAIAALPPGYRMVFILHDIEGYNHQEIADMLNISAGTSKSQLHKARQHLRRSLAPFLVLDKNL